MHDGVQVSVVAVGDDRRMIVKDGSCNCSFVSLRLGEFKETCVGHALSRSIREKGQKQVQ